jgi:hypothetical protein
VSINQPPPLQADRPLQTLFPFQPAPLHNGRRNLEEARANVAGALRIAESHTRKRSLLSALNLLVRIRDCSSMEANIRASLESSSYVEVGTDGQCSPRHHTHSESSLGLMDSARHVITRIMKPRFVSWAASYDVASTVNQSLCRGGVRVRRGSEHAADAGGADLRASLGSGSRISPVGRG